MKVLKFGGTSVGSAERMKQVAKLVADDSRKIVVLSAVSGTTNSLVAIGEQFGKDNKSDARKMIEEL
ncbi:MAG: aspartate kinase, partial [Saprospiraceae bacterium]